MEKEQIKVLSNDMFKNIIEDYVQEYGGENISNIELMDFSKNIKDLLQNCEISEEAFMDGLIELGIPKDLVSSLNMVRKSVDYLMLFFEQSFESLHDSILSISLQIHADKIERANQARKQFERAINSKNPNEGLKNLSEELNGEVISNLLSDMKVKIYEINKVPREGEGMKKMLFGWLKARKIRHNLEELKETLPIYIDTILLISMIDLYFGEITNARLTLKDALQTIESLFPYKQPSENRMYTLTDDNAWIEIPQNYCHELEQNLYRLEFLVATNKTKEIQINH